MCDSKNLTIQFRFFGLFRQILIKTRNNFKKYYDHSVSLLYISVAARSKAYVCCRSHAEIAGSSPTLGMSVCRECCVLSGRGFCDGLITRTEESYRMWCVVVCDLLPCWDSGFKTHRRHGCLSVVSVVCCQVEVSATGWSLVQRSPTDCDVSLCVIY